ncbi:hypothetical protein LCAM36_0151 [Lacticaseibacillus paracasei]|nr:hypothetical protein LCA211_2805 [Lacticaseibacillus casei 21/1]EKP97036.1 hypothetical protein LCA32G_1329 [Lacticaseibacillus paracasei]EKQ12789.1 hypothetical protein LCAM36_0151 [Lacticaseibacillus paracasei]
MICVLSNMANEILFVMSNFQLLANEYHLNEDLNLVAVE